MRPCPSASKESSSTCAVAPMCPAPDAWEHSSCFRWPVRAGKVMRRENHYSGSMGPRSSPSGSWTNTCSGSKGPRMLEAFVTAVCIK